MKLFDTEESRRRLEQAKPLAARMQPRTIEEFVGQEHFIGEGRLLWRMLKADRLTSLIFYGPPGTGKTALAHVIANTTQAKFVAVNASGSGVSEVRDVLSGALTLLETTGRRTVLFVDELHRFNRAQQDVLLPDVERGIVILIGATTQNPFFSINSPLISRSQIFQFKALESEHVVTILKQALADKERGLGRLKVRITDDVMAFLAQTCDGDARRALGALEIGVFSQDVKKDKPITYDLEVAQESIQRKALVYDGTGDEHYDAASAFIKSMRGSDPDAALYWMARMLESGEDPRFIARRMVICASEDVGNANPQALVLATAALQAVEFVGMPEAQIPLAQAVTYIACSPKSNAAYLGIAEAMKDVKEGRTIEVPDHLKDASYKGAKRLGRGEGYKYAHDFEGHWVDQDYLGVDREYYRPTTEGFESKIKERLDRLREMRKKGKRGKDEPGG